MKLQGTILILLFLSKVVFAQNASLKISGQIIDAATNLPLSNAHVYFSGTTMLANTDSLGKFTLKREVAEGRHTLVFSHVGYETKIAKITVVNSESLSFNILLVPKEVKLKEVLISATKDVAWQKNYARFKEEFLGSSSLAKECLINNPWILEFKTKNDQLTVSADGELIIDNKGLGYKVYCTLVNFSNVGFQTSYIGVYRFEPMRPQDKKQQKKWKKRREKAFYGSFRHFVYALLHDKVKEEGFSVMVSKDSPAKVKRPRTKFTKMSKLFTQNDEGSFLRSKRYVNVMYLKRGEGVNYIRYIAKQAQGYKAFSHKKKRLAKGDLIDLNDKDIKLNYNGNRIYRYRKYYQSSWMYLLTEKLKVSRFGVVLDKPTNLETYGYWAWQRVGDMLPFDFVPARISKQHH
ncbi:hypothetical protein BKI52_27740 [marine bacterium AO1-C]|nr:hypothetical protein BKI52_27740 [marine bacterium AO1-C]